MPNNLTINQAYCNLITMGNKFDTPLAWSRISSYATIVHYRARTKLSISGNRTWLEILQFFKKNYKYHEIWTFRLIRMLHLIVPVQPYRKMVRSKLGIETRQEKAKGAAKRTIDLPVKEWQLPFPVSQAHYLNTHSAGKLDRYSTNSTEAYAGNLVLQSC